jgi:hypothetical protein
MGQCHPPPSPSCRCHPRLALTQSIRSFAVHR